MDMCVYRHSLYLFLAKAVDTWEQVAVLMGFREATTLEESQL